MKNALSKGRFALVISKGIWTEKKVFGLLSGVIFLYLVIKAAIMPFVLDEATSFVEFVHMGWEYIIPGNARWTTNNHLLNSLLMWISYRCFGSSEFALRLPNVLAFIVYAFAVFKLMKHLNNRLLRWLFVIGLLSPLYIIDFFAMARGYGLSFAFALLAFALWLETLDNQKRYIWAEFSLFLAVAANLNFLYVWPAWWVLSLIRDAFVLRYSVKKIVFLRFISTALLSVHIAYGIILKHNFTFDLGLQSGYLRTLKSHLYFCYASLGNWALGLLIAFAGILVIGFLLKRKELRAFSWFFPGIITLTVATYVFGNLLVQLPLPAGRIGLYLYLLWFPAMVFIVDAFDKKTGLILALPIAGLVLVSMVDAAKNFSFKNHKEFTWAREQMSEQLLSHLQSNANYAYSSPHYYHSNIAYQSIKNPSFPFVNAISFGSQFSDAYLYSVQERDEIINRIGKEEQFGSIYVSANQNPSVKTLIASGDTTISFDGDKEIQHFYGISPEAQKYFIDVEVAVNRPEGLVPLLLCAHVTDSTGVAKVWQAINLNHYVDTFNGTKRRYYFFIDEVPNKARDLALYFWSTSNKNIDRINVKFKVYSNTAAEN